jgi:hypothetical protein
MRQKRTLEIRNRTTMHVKVGELFNLISLHDYVISCYSWADVIEEAYATF